MRKGDVKILINSFILLIFSIMIIKGLDFMSSSINELFKSFIYLFMGMMGIVIQLLFNILLCLIHK